MNILKGTRAGIAGALAIAIALTACGGSDRSDLVKDGRQIFRDAACSVCHGGVGEGGVGPPLAGVADTFAACSDQVAWVRLGSERWKSERGETYGDSAKPVKGAMPSFDASLTIERIRTVVAYERIAFGGLEEAAVRADCGL